MTSDMERAQSGPRRDPVPLTASCEFPPSAFSVTQARHWASGVALSWSIEGGALSRVALSVTELAANAVVHARSPFRVRLELDGRRLRLEVEDASPEPPREMHAAPEATAGRGVALVAALSRRTGVERGETPGKRVWAELDVSS